MILVTGGAGYIGSHTVKKLIEKGNEVLIIDNLSRGFREAVHPDAVFEKGDILDFELLINIFAKYQIDSVIHFAAFAYVGESVENPEIYYKNNVVGSYNLINALKECSINNIVFSSTCSVYGNPLQVPISENESLKPINPYARTKLMIENILSDFSNAYGIKYVALRYFNAAGCSEYGTIGESHNPETHLIPLVMHSIMYNDKKLKVFGNDYDTRDGTCIRDYIHVNDLADAHIKALDYINTGQASTAINLGTGEGNSVMDIIRITEEVTGMNARYEIVPRREGDPAILVADNKKAEEILGWQPEYSLKRIIESAWNWQKNKKY
jgi:UDP-glucose 4-epimerase